MFINELFQEDVKAIESQRPLSYRVKPIAWASEGLCTLGSINIGTCQRELFYKALGVPGTNTRSVRNQRIMGIGLLAEDYLINRFKANGKHVIDQARVEFVMPNTVNNVESSGKIDEIIKEDNRKKGIEVKSIGGYKLTTIFGKVIGNQKPKIALPASHNLMQAMTYKWKAMNGGIGEHKVDEIYLAYVCREDFTNMFFLVDIDDQGFPVLTPIDMQGHRFTTIRLQDVSSYNQLINAGTPATAEQGRLAELRININDMFNKFDTTYSYIREKILPPKDYSLIYSDKEIEKEYLTGRINKDKYDKHRGISSKTGKSIIQHKIGDWKCNYCDFQSKCLADDGIRRC